MSAPDFDPEAPSSITFRGPDILVRAAEVIREKIHEDEERVAEQIEATRPATALECLEATAPLGWLLARLPAWEAALGCAHLRLELVSYDAAAEGPSGEPHEEGRRDEEDARGMWCPNARERDSYKASVRRGWEAALVEWVQGEIDRGRDVAASSRLSWKTKGSVRYGHLPCYDFALKCPSADGVSHTPADCHLPPSGTRERAALRIHTASLTWFASGRSWHAYDERGPLPWSTWARLMGGALSLNRGGAEVLDHGWLAFALARGYAALRVTRTDPGYLALPSRLPWPPSWGAAGDRGRTGGAL